GTLAAPNYALVFVNGTLTISQATLTVTADDKSKIYGAANPSLTASYSGFVNGDTTAILTGAPSLSTVAAAASPVGAYAITTAAGTLAATNYAFAFANGTLRVGGVAPSWFNIGSQSIVYGTDSVTFAGRLVAGSLAPPAAETIVVELNGVQQTPQLQPD